MQKRSFIPVITEEHIKELPKELPVFLYQTLIGDTPLDYLHTHNLLEVGICLTGSGVFSFHGQMRFFSKGDISVFCRGTPHYANASPGIKTSCRYIFFDPSELLSGICDRPEILSSSIINSNDFPCIFRKKEFPEISLLIKKAMKLYDEKKLWFETEIRTVLLQALIQIQRNANIPKNTSHNDATHDFSAITRISPALNYILSNYNSEIIISDLAKMCGMSIETLRRQFKKAVKKSPEQYIQNMRIQIAASLLENTLDPIGGIAFKTGFKTVSCFNRQFKKIMSIPPRQWRKKHV